jgi:hypothetical protein
MIAIVILLSRNIRKGRILNFASFVLIPFFIHLILLNIDYNIIELRYGVNIIAKMISGLIITLYSFISFPFFPILMINTDIKIIIIIGGIALFWGTLVMNILVKLFINLEVNTFKYEKDINKIILLSYLQSSSYFSILFILYD